MAGLLSSILGSQVSASADTASPSREGSQALGLLDANVSSTAIIDSQKAKSGKSDDVNTDSEEVNILSDNALLPSVSPADIGGSTDSSFDQISVYVVHKGDTISTIANLFGVSENTIRWNNDLKKGAVLKEGDTLFILPVSGVKHVVTKGQTLGGIAKLYKVSVTDITSFNGIDSDAPLSVGDELIIPDGIRTEENARPIQNLGASIARDQSYYVSHPLPNLTGYFINPVPGARKSQGIHDRNAVDLAIAKGTPIYAAAEGTVTLARNSGYNGGFGKFVIIQHPNGTETLYAHQTKVIVTSGTQVYQGQVIGYVGSTGHSTGPHLHFEVHGAQNPGVDGSWKY